MVSAADAYRADAARDVRLTLYGPGGAIALLFSAFVVFLSRSARAREDAERLAAANHELFQVSHEHATMDALTGLGNRRALTADLDAALAQDEQVVLALFDLDGFKGLQRQLRPPGRGRAADAPR